MSDQLSDIDLVSYVDEAKADAIHAFNVLRQNGTLSASLTFHISHRVPGHDLLLSIRFPGGLARDQAPTIGLSKFSEAKGSILNEARLDADTAIHVHTSYLSAWSLAHKPFPILYVAAARHLLAREIPNHLERTRSVLEVISERLDKHPELAPPPALLESNGGANFWGKGIIKTAETILFVEEAARYQALAEQIGGAQVYTPGALELQWKRTGLLEKSKAYSG
ncbi:class II aldolase/adducin family protein [Janthinobacterium sp. 17J80-10]|uniref:class II aldolase/adducin family protein n=1 Tax=Janthinobacterium sp. 17J80-10 TaxID=2497863 RepID=UPI0010056189|nr:class II aldolase/adducin family protein [Janthinobacterium sp. 17J80-10]QAU33995.1 class II aldolase/adducin family protein [Janthinobacterium sp. 17J80-10]